MEHRTLEINLQYAKDLNKVNLITKMDVYADVSISGGNKNSKQKTRTPVDHDGDNNPTWNFPLKFAVDEAALQMNRLTLDFHLICERALGDKNVGEVHVPIKELLDSAANGGGYGKQFVSYQVRKPSGRPKGQLTFSYKFSEKPVGASSAPPYGSAMPTAPKPGKISNETVMAYPAGSSSGYPQPGAYPPPAGYPAVHGSGHYPPPAPYPAVEGSGQYPPPAPYPAVEGTQGSGHYPPPATYPAVEGTQGSGHYPPPAPYPAAEGSGYYPPPPAGYPPAGGAPAKAGYPYPPSHSGYGYPPPPPPGYGYRPQPGYGYSPPPVVQQPKKNKLGLGLGAGLLGGALGGLLVGDMISDVADFDGGFDF